MNQLSFIGHNSLIELKKQLIELDLKRIFLVRGKGSFVDCGAENALTPIFHELRNELFVYKDFTPNPKMEEVLNGVEIFMQSNADCILAVGGGSVIDMAKLIRHFTAEKGRQTTLLAMPTTSGTGAEATHFAVVYVDGKKQSIEADDILPDIAFVYPPFSYKASTYLTACTGFDALAQAIEAYWNKNATPESDEYAIKAISLIHQQLPMCVKNPTKELRDDLSVGAYWAGKAINITKTTAPHAFSYAFTSKCGYPHGHAVALTFPFFAELNMKDNNKGTILSEQLKIVNSNWKKHFADYTEKIGLEFNGTGGYDLMSLLQDVNLQRLANNPVTITEYEIKQLELLLK